MLHEEQVKSCHSLAHSPPWLLTGLRIKALVYRLGHELNLDLALQPHLLLSS